MAIRKRPGRPRPYEVYWNNPFTGKRETKYFSTKCEAEKENSLVLHRLKYEKEYFRPTDENDDFQDGTVNQILALYLSESGMSGINLTNTLHHLKTITKTFGKRDVVTLEKADLVSYMAKQRQSGVKVSTAHRRLSILRAALSWAEDRGYISSNPLRGFKISKGRPERIPPPSYMEAEKLIESSPPHLLRAILLSLYLGVRVGPSELLAIRWDDVDMDRGLVRVWSAKKNPDMPYRDLPLREDLLRHIKTWYEKDTPISPFPETVVHWQGRPIKSFKRAWASLKERCGITRKLRPYDLRHAFATFALNSGADIKSVAEMMNHSDPSMILEHYQHTSESTKRAIVEALPNVARKCGSKKEGSADYD